MTDFLSQFITAQNIDSWVRHALTGFGGSLVTSGALASDQVQVGIGALATLAGLAWSWFTHKPAKKTP